MTHAAEGVGWQPAALQESTACTMPHAAEGVGWQPTAHQ